MTELYKYLRQQTHDALIEDYKGEPAWIITLFVPARKKKLAYMLDQNALNHFDIKLNIAKLFAPENEYLDPTNTELDAFAKFYKLLQTKEFGEYISNNCAELPGRVITFDGPSLYDSIREYGGEYYVEDNNTYIIV